VVFADSRGRFMQKVVADVADFTVNRVEPILRLLPVVSLTSQVVRFF